MASNGYGDHHGVVHESNTAQVNSSSLHVSTSQRGLITNEKSPSRFYGSTLSFAKRLKFFNIGNLVSPSEKFHQMAGEREEISRNVPSSSSLHLPQRLTRLFSRKIDRMSLWKMFKEWIRSPFNIALFMWILCVAVSGAILFLVMTGMLNHAIRKKSQRDIWFEVNNQILNALFTLMCLYQHPKRLYHFILLMRWRPEDVSWLRKNYCKNGTYKPHEWRHMMVVVLLLNLNCFAQYALCGLNLGYRRSDRPVIGVGITISVAIGTPAIAGVYAMLSPLGKDYDTELDEEAQLQTTTGQSSRASQLRRKSVERTFSFASNEGRTVETRPQWSGGILDFWNDISQAYLSLFCSFCVFGWNMERLGFGNMYVHIATFLLFCMAPFWIFNLAAVNIDNDTVRAALGLTGVFLCLFGLLYGGFWRIQMRKRYNLPAYNFCCGRPAIADCALWLFCCWCSLAQEVRTGDSYDIMEDKFYKKPVDEGGIPAISPLPREDGVFRSSPGHPLAEKSSPPQILKNNASSPSRYAVEFQSPSRQSAMVEVGSHVRGNSEIMTPPAPSVIRREDV